MSNTPLAAATAVRFDPKGDVCAIETTGGVACAPIDPELGHGWQKLPGLAGAIEFAEPGDLQADDCVLLRDETVRCWSGSSNAKGYVFDNEPYALRVDDVAEVVSGTFGVCVRTGAGAVRCAQTSPTQPELDTVVEAGATELDAGFGHWCARIDDDGREPSERVVCHGDNRFGALGTLGQHVMLTPTPIVLPCFLMDPEPALERPFAPELEGPLWLLYHSERAGRREFGRWSSS